ncbi:MAG TPA: hypothetical protein VK537_04800 [Galbitalea sp.]|nr:hypothetical protein [Galbitalea sp.]
MSRLSPHAAISHSTAAIVWEIPLPVHWESDVVHVTVPIGLRAPQHRGVRGHQRTLDTADISAPHGFRMTTPVRTWCDLAELTSLAELVAAGDFLIHWQTPLTTATALEEYSTRNPQRRGTRVRRAALPLLSDRSESFRESILRVLILAAGFPAPDVNHEVRDDRGRILARVDLAWPDHKVALEYEGDHHRTDRAQWQRDLRRIEALQDAGWRVIRVSSNDLDLPGTLFDRLRRLLEY